ncbi:MAG: hypothetical protein KatS3mg032_2316 [Cyclobacteriaceae bacterium]|nr:MAG: hypothetical protein KatS3mg032_2316 [Cyclobacteriaceae bacterium]
MKTIFGLLRKSFTGAVLLTALLAVLFAGVFFLLDARLPDMVMEIEDNLEEVVTEAEAHAQGLMQNKRVQPNRDQSGLPEDVFCFLIQDERIVWWSDNKVWPGFQADTSWTYVRLPSGHFLQKKISASHNIQALVLVALEWRFRIQNNYLRAKSNPNIFRNYRAVVSDGAPGDQPVKLRGRTAFFVRMVPGYTHVRAAAAVLAGVSAIMMILMLWANWIKSARLSPFYTFSCWVAGLVLLRWIMIVVRFPARFMDTALFDPKYFASSWFNPSLGDLFLNMAALCAVCAMWFRWFGRFKPLWVLHRNKNLMAGLFSATAVYFGWLFPFVVVQTLYNNSSVALGITESLAFDYLRITAFSVLVLSWICSFLFVHPWARLLCAMSGNVRLHYALSGLVVFAAVNVISGQMFAWAALAGSVYLALAAGGGLARPVLKTNYHAVAYLLLILTCFSAVTYAAIKHFSEYRDVQQRKRMALYFLSDRDNLAEYLLHEMRSRIMQDAFIISRLSGPFLNRDAVKQKIRQAYLAGYHARYKTDIMLFSATGEPMDEQVNVNFSAWLRQQENTAQRTEYEGIYYQRLPADPSGYYLVVIPVSRESDIRAAFVVLRLSLPRFIPETVYPELLVDDRYRPRFPDQLSDYAVFYRNNVVVSSGDFAYHRFKGLDNPALFTAGITESGYHHVGVKSTDERIAVISRPVPSLTRRIADFSFITILGLGCLVVWLTFRGFEEYRTGHTLTLSTRIQLMLNFSFFLSLTVVSAVTLGVTARAVQRQLNADFQNRSVNLAKELSAWLNESGNGQGMDLPGNEFLRKVRLMGVDANLFSANGKLLAATQPLIFEYQLQAPVAAPAVIKRMHAGEPAFVTSDRIGGLSFYSAYAGIYLGEQRTLVAFLQIPYFRSQREEEELQTGVLANILTVFLLLLVLLSVVSLIASRFVVRPLTLIAKQLGKVSITGINLPLEWRSKDEIGMLVQQYNHMLDKLKQSVAELERTHRERTWREIAQQVAHEIKNPLTPMKLILQQLQRQAGDTDARLRRQVDALLEQVEVLDGIATSFSTFAKMPEPVMEPVDLISLLDGVVRLYREAGAVTLETRLKQAFVKGDAKLLHRIFSNLVLNAVQAAKPGESARVTIRVLSGNASFRIEVEDNGVGVDEALRDKIFLPHFTTRKSGSGLGLAIARQGIGHMGGTISFTSAIGRGTTFTVTLPAA